MSQQSQPKRHTVQEVDTAFNPTRTIVLCVDESEFSQHALGKMDL